METEVTNNLTFVDVTTLIANISTSLSIIITIIGAIIAYKTFKDSKKRKIDENAVSLALFFQTSILNEASHIFALLKDSDYSSIMQKIKLSDMRLFNIEEIKSLTNNENILAEIESAIKKLDPKKIVFYLNLCDTPNCNDNKIISTSIRHYVESDDTNLLYSAMKSKIISILNQLEWFAMNLNSNIANEEIIYQSLHQTFITFIATFYYFICSFNNAGYNKYYTNIIELYNLWLARQTEMKMAEDDAKRKVENAVKFEYQKVKN